MLILSKDRPSISLYYLGSKLIKFMEIRYIDEIHLSTLYEKFNNIYPITFNRFMLVLDWLFTLGLIKAESDGKLIYVPKRISN
jgi:hypothetical protein